MRLHNEPWKRNALAVALGPILAIALAFGACTKGAVDSTASSPQAPDDRSQALAAENAKLAEQLKAAEASDAEAAATIAEVQTGLEEIRGKELRILRKTLDVTREGQPRVSTRESLSKEMETIRTAIRENLGKLARLERERKASGQKMASLQNLVDELRRSLEEKGTTIATLEKKVMELDEKVKSQEGVLLAKDVIIREKDDVIEARTKAMNTGFVAMAGKKVLKQKGVVEKKGTVLGLGGTWQETGKFDPDVFRVIDTTTEAELAIPAPAAKVKILPGHPGESYRIVSAGPRTSTLKVTDRDAFWRDSRYLVVMID
jgi:hypothetical protein